MIKDINILKYKDGKIYKSQDPLAYEDFFEIFLNNKLIYTTMRTPQKDEELAIGLCFSEGIIDSVDDIQSIEVKHNQAFVYIDKKKNKKANKESYKDNSLIKAEILFKLRDDFVSRMEIFQKTGCAHASALFDRNLNMLAFAEDVGRHNALDKAIGHVLKNKKEKDVFLCLMSSRLSYEIFKKAKRLKVNILAGISAPTYLAVEMAKKSNITIIGFLRNQRMNIYTYPERVSF